MKITVRKIEAESIFDDMDDKAFGAKMDSISKAFRKPAEGPSHSAPADMVAGDYGTMPYEAFMDDVNGLTIAGEKAFSVRQAGEDIELTLLLDEVPAGAMEDPKFQALCEDRLQVISPIAADHWTLYVEEWTPQEFANPVLIERGNSKMPEDDEGWARELKELALALASDCKALGDYFEGA